MSHTLAQNGHCELLNGMYLTGKKLLSHLKRLDRVFDGNPMLFLNVGRDCSDCKNPTGDSKGT